jgi:two-component system phosphate regulon sensor histidine kinase PhoR
VAMKRIFPLIIVLITLSLLGIIVLQVSWFRDMTLLRKVQLRKNAEEATTEAAIELGKHASSAPFFKIPRKQNLSLLPNDYAIGYGRPLLSQHFSAFEIKEKIRKAFNSKGLEDVHFEFGVTSNSSAYTLELQTDNFFKEADDTMHNRSIIVPILPPDNENILQPREPFEHLIVIIPNFKIQVLESMMWV